MYSCLFKVKVKVKVKVKEKEVWRTLNSHNMTSHSTTWLEERGAGGEGRGGELEGRRGELEGRGAGGERRE